MIYDPNFIFLISLKKNDSPEIKTKIPQLFPT